MYIFVLSYLETNEVHSAVRGMGAGIKKCQRELLQQ